LGGSGAVPNVTEANATAMVTKTYPGTSPLVVRVDAELDTTNALYYVYHCKLQYKAFPALLGAPYTDVPSTHRSVSWRLGRESSGPGAAVSISMQGTVTPGALGADVRMVCWGTWDGASPPIVDYGVGVAAATLTLLPVGSIG
jgi:hypothetical protein